MKKRQTANIALKHISSLDFYEFAPTYLYPLKQGLLVDSQPMVHVGQTVKTGELIAQGKGYSSKNIHSAVGGKVKTIKKMNLASTSHEENVVQIQLGGEIRTYNELHEVSTEVLTLRDIISTMETHGLQDNDINNTSNISEMFRNRLEKGTDQIIINAVEMQSYGKLEEKILMSNMDKVVESIGFLLQLYRINSTGSIPEIVCNSSVRVSRNEFVKRLKKKQTHGRIDVRKLYLKPQEEDMVLPGKYADRFLQIQKRYSKDLAIKDTETMLMVKPSVLVMFYDSVFHKKPMIDKYVQIVTSTKSAYFLKVLLGTPLLHILTHLDVVHPKMKHFFYTDPHKSHAITNFMMPITKDSSYFFLFDDEQFAKFQQNLE